VELPFINWRLGRKLGYPAGGGPRWAQSWTLPPVVREALPAPAISARNQRMRDVLALAGQRLPTTVASVKIVAQRGPPPGLDIQLCVRGAN